MAGSVCPIFNEESNFIGIWALNKNFRPSPESLIELRSLAEPTFKVLKNNPYKRIINQNTDLGNGVRFEGGIFLMMNNNKAPNEELRDPASKIKYTLIMSETHHVACLIRSSSGESRPGSKREEKIQQITRALDNKSTPELEQLLENHETNVYTAEAFEAMKKILASRESKMLVDIGKNIKPGESPIIILEAKKEEQRKEHYQKDLKKMQDELDTISKSIKSLRSNRKIYFGIGIAILFMSLIASISTGDWSTVRQWTIMVLIIFGLPAGINILKSRKLLKKRIDLDAGMKNLSMKIHSSEEKIYQCLFVGADQTDTIESDTKMPAKSISALGQDIIPETIKLYPIFPEPKPSKLFIKELDGIKNKSTSVIKNEPEILPVFKNFNDKVKIEPKLQCYMCLAIADHLHTMFGEVIALKMGLKSQEKLNFDKCSYVTFWRAKASTENLAHQAIRKVFNVLGMKPIEIITLTSDISRLSDSHRLAFDTIFEENASLETEGSIAFLRSSTEAKKLALKTARNASMPR